MSACAIVMPAWPDTSIAADDALARVTAHLRAQLADVPAAQRIIACSGGLDSSVLLAVLAHLHAAEGQPPPRALHVDHALNPASNDWAEALAERCRGLGVELDMWRVQVERTDAGLEADARRARYAAFAEALAEGGTLLLAHHRDDQTETILLRLLRGAGPAGLAGMPVRRTLGAGELRRPLLDFDRRDLVAAAEALALEICEDPSNTALQHDRNYLRHVVLPVLGERWPGYRQTLTRAAAACAEQETALAELLGPLPQALPVTELNGAPEVAAVRLRHWLASVGVAAPSRRQLQDLLRQADARDDAGVCIELGPWQIRRFAGALHAVPASRPEPPTDPMRWQPPAPLTLSHGRLEVEPAVGEGLSTTASPMEVRFRTGGERLRPAGRVGRHALKDLFQEARIPPWERDRVPLLYVAGELVAIAGLVVAEGWQAATGAPGWRLRWTPSDR